MVMSINIRKYSVFILLLFIACNRPPKPTQDFIRQSKIPEMIIVKKEIKGEILGNRLKQPFGLAIDFKGNIYVSDAGNNRLLRFDSDFKADYEIGGYGSQPGLLNNPSFLICDNGLNVIVSDEGNRRISRYNSQLNFVDETAFYDFDDPLKFGYPSGIAFTSYGELWVADREKNRIAVFNNVGKFEQFYGDYGYPGGQLSSPEKIIYNDKNFIVCDAGNSRLVVYDNYGNYLKEINNEQFDYPMSAVFDNNHLWVLDGATGEIFYLAQNGKSLFTIGPSLPGNSIALNAPSDILILPDNRMLIADTGNDRLLVCSIIYENK